MSSTGVLLSALVLLLVGICSQLRTPAVSDAPAGVTTVTYSVFVQYVKAGDVAAIAMRGNEVNALLWHSLSRSSTTASHTSQAAQNAQAYETWMHYINGGKGAWVTAGVTADTSRYIFTTVPATGDAQLLPLLLKSQVKVNTLPTLTSSNFLALVWRFSPLLVAMIALLLLLGLRTRGNSLQRIDERITSIGKSRARSFIRLKESTRRFEQPLQSPTTDTTTPPVIRPAPRLLHHSRTTFADVAGIDEVRAELEEIVQFLRQPERFNKLGARIPRGALLVGPPGTGKTLLARAVAGEANVPFFSMSASEFVELFVGVGASRVRDLFSKARQAAPCVIFIDELDAAGRKRAAIAYGNDERDQTLNQLLTELDGFDTRQAVVVLAATNRVDILDKALLRPGRFDRHITVSLPDRAGREAILNVHTRSTPLHEGVSLAHLARLTTGMSGADLANLVNEASLVAARLDLEDVTHECFEQALARVQLGVLRSLVMSEQERRIIAYHESGHALVAHYLPAADTVNRVTILPRGQSLGVTQFVAEEDRYHYSRHMLMAKIAVGLGGRVAEELTFGREQVTTGAENDLRVVTDVARRMVTRWGMSEAVGVVFAAGNGENDYRSHLRQFVVAATPSSVSSASTTSIASFDVDGTVHLTGQLPETHYALAATNPSAQTFSSTPMMALIDTEVQRILHEGYVMARAILTEHSDQLLLLATTLMEQEQLDRKQFDTLLALP